MHLSRYMCVQLRYIFAGGGGGEELIMERLNDYVIEVYIILKC
jgi:hypothetical protein